MNDRTFGPTYDEKRDKNRLDNQRNRILRHMLDGRWRPLFEISQDLSYPEASISAQLRHLRKPQFGAWKVDRRHIQNGLWEYRIRTPETPL